MEAERKYGIQIFVQIVDNPRLIMYKSTNQQLDAFEFIL